MQKTAYEMRISDWSSDVCSSDLNLHHHENDWRKGASTNGKADAATPLRRTRSPRVARSGRFCELSGMGAHASCAGRTMNSRKLSMEYAAAGFTELRLSDEGNGVLSRPGRTEAGRFTPGGLMALFLALALAEIGRAHVGTPVTHE